MAGTVPARLTAAQGRRFAFTVGTAMLVLAGVLVWRGKRPVAIALATIGALLIVAGLAAPTHLGPVERAWYALAAAISKVTTPIVMGVLYFVVITPAGLLMRALGRNPLPRPAPGASAWVSRPENARRGDLERQF
jgi:DMSO reductase anchor subunit